MRDISTISSSLEEQLSQPVHKISVVTLVDLFIEAAMIAGASDIHIQPEAKGVRVRFRVDGILRDLFPTDKISSEINHEIISRIKVISGLRTDEHLAPQDGRFKSRIDNLEDVDVRVSIVPTYYGENAVLRVLAATQTFELADLGFSEAGLKKIERSIQKPYGMILANGPTGSGKTTTLYTILKKLNKAEVSIITIEDPIEYSLEGTTQIQVNTQTGLTFANGLRSILRQDPNTVMVGEIRDEETAGIAVNAALTGHLVLSTLHTNDAATTFPRLIDMGVPPFLVASTVNIAMGQRLVRQICPKCKIERTLTGRGAQKLEGAHRGAHGRGQGFLYRQRMLELRQYRVFGRIGIREVLEVNKEIRTHHEARDRGRNKRCRGAKRHGDDARGRLRQGEAGHYHARRSPAHYPRIKNDPATS
jgi:type IV pilus assembly protein PilB